ncbi:MAG: pyruvate, phosphate dikinase [Puniceicoccales bacterium]|jgi:pyruvate,orthophosphate dikinase|nr:pyruvate, phosphate dikinase [Puniceicoccales bacterium]
MAEEKYVYEFGVRTDGNAKMRELLGGKGANLAEMARIGLPVPPGFTITTAVCTLFSTTGRLPEAVEKQKYAALKHVEEQVGRKFGDADNPLLFSVRSGARESMPGMMDTILNLGLNDRTVRGLADATRNPRFAYDSYRRFIQMYGDVVMEVHAKDDHSADPFEEILDAAKKKAAVQFDNQLNAEQLQDVIGHYKEVIRKATGRDFPQDVNEQLLGAIGAVFRSWNNERAILYRQKYAIPADWGTAVNVQSMVFGNMGKDSATGVAFTRDPANGENVFYGEYLIDAQGEDVVAGIRTPNPIADLERDMPTVFAELTNVRQKLERHFCDMQDFEFTVQQNKLYMLQTRNGKRTGFAAVRIALEMEKEGLIDKKTAIKRIPAESISSLLVPIFDDEGKKKAKLIARGLPAGPGAASGKVCFSAQKAEELHSRGERALLCRAETSPEDIRGMLASEGILTSRGGVSSHAALVARQMGKVCVVGAATLEIDYGSRTMKVGDLHIKEGDELSIDGTAGEVFLGAVGTVPSEVNQVLAGTLAAEKSSIYASYACLMGWCDECRKLRVYINADSPRQAEAGLCYGGEGIGLTRTEHMFFEGNRIDFMREMILADTEENRERAVAKLLPLQRKDFIGIFMALHGKPATIRFLDPPLHEFVPHDEATQRSLAQKVGIPLEKVKARVHALQEFNPMLGHRGCRLGISYPEVSRMQARAIFEAVVYCKSNGVPVHPEIMIPLVGFVKELRHQVNIVHEIAAMVKDESGVNFDYMVGTMLELPRACLRAGEIAEIAEFCSFGSNDLTQTTLGMSRDDMGSFLGRYNSLEIFATNPFATIDKEGVGELMQMAVERARKTRKDIILGICGEHGGDPASVKFCHSLGLTYVSCSPNRVPVAKLAAAQAALEDSRSR